MAEAPRILLIDEPRTSTRTLLDALDSEGFSTATCASVLAARRRLQRESPILLLRAELEGAAELLTEKHPLILLSSFPHAHPLPEGCEELCEPVSPEDLVRAVRRIGAAVGGPPLPFRGLPADSALQSAADSMDEALEALSA